MEILNCCDEGHEQMQQTTWYLFGWIGVWSSEWNVPRFLPPQILHKLRLLKSLQHLMFPTVWWPSLGITTFSDPKNKVRSSNTMRSPRAKYLQMEACSWGKRWTGAQPLVQVISPYHGTCQDNPGLSHRHHASDRLASLHPCLSPASTHLALKSKQDSSRPIFQDLLVWAPLSWELGILKSPARWHDVRHIPGIVVVTVHWSWCIYI